MCERAIIVDGYIPETSTYDFSHIFRNIRRHTTHSDITIASLETKFVYGEAISGTNRYNSPREFGQALREIGIDVLNMASNHSYDYGLSGIISTLDFLDELGFYTTRNE